MNLLAVSRLTNQEAVVHLQKGNSYVLFPQENGRRRKIPLIERNGLFILALEVEDATPNEATACPAVTKDVHGPAATMNLWHKRLGCSKAKIGFMNKQAVGEGMNIRGVSTGCDKACKCIKCTLARAERINPRK